MSRASRAVSSYSSSRLAVAAAALALILSAFLVYASTLRAPFIFDDQAAIIDNPTLRTWTEALRPPKGGTGVAGRPLVNASLAVNYAISGTQPWSYHVANTLFHAAAALALFGCVRRTLQHSPVAGSLHAVAFPFAFLAALLWLVHPLQTESVACVIQRTELLVGLFLLLTLYAFIRSATSGTHRRFWGVVAVTAGFLGMASKEVMVTAPVLVLLYDRTFLAGSFAGAWRQRRGLHVALFAGWLLLAAELICAGGSRGSAAGFGQGVSAFSYALKQCEAILLYLKLTAWPHPLVVFYGIDVVHSVLAVWPQLLALIALVAATVWALLRLPWLGFLGAWFFVILSPSSSIVPLVTQTVAEHRMYLPLAGPLLALLVAAFAILPRMAILASTCVAIAFTSLSLRRNQDFQSGLSIWNDTVAKAPANARAHVNLGAELKAIGQLDRALHEYETAFALDPQSAEAVNNIATIYIERGQPREAIAPCETALRINPDYALAHNNLGSALLALGRVNEGVEHLQTALRVRPNLAEAHANLAGVLLNQGDPAGARQHAEAALASRPHFTLAELNLGRAFLAQRDWPRAVAAFEAVLQHEPRNLDAHTLLGGALYQAGRPAEAVPHFAAALQPDARSHNNLASALAQSGRLDEAIQQYREAVALQPGYAEGYTNLAIVLRNARRVPEAIAVLEQAPAAIQADAGVRTLLAQLRGAAP